MNKTELMRRAIEISLFSDRRVSPDELGGQSDDLRGFWAESQEAWGSRLWLLEREKLTQDILVRAREYALEALGWLSGCEVEVVRSGSEEIHFVVTHREERFVLPWRLSNQV